MNRRHFLKTLATLAAGTAAVVAPAVVRGKSSDRSVVYGKMGFTMRIRKRPTRTIFVMSGDTPFHETWICVDVIEDLKSGDILRWYPNGSVGKT